MDDDRMAELEDHQPEIRPGIVGGAALIDALSSSKSGGINLAKYLSSGLLPPVLAALLAKQLVQHLYNPPEDAQGVEKQASPLLAMARAYSIQKRAAALMKPQGALRNSMAVAYSSAPPTPQTTPVGGPRKVTAHQTGPKVKLPSKTRFFNDQSKANMGYSGNRLGVPNAGK